MNYLLFGGFNHITFFRRIEPKQKILLFLLLFRPNIESFLVSIDSPFFRQNLTKILIFVCEIKRVDEDFVENGGNLLTTLSRICFQKVSEKRHLIAFLFSRIHHMLICCVVNCFIMLFLLNFQTCEFP